MKSTKPKRYPKGVPYWSFKGDARAWRRHKRAEWRDVMKAIKKFQSGCAFVPDYETTITKFFELTSQISESLSPGKWGK